MTTEERLQALENRLTEIERDIAVISDCIDLLNYSDDAKPEVGKLHGIKFILDPTIIGGEFRPPKPE